MDDLITMTKIDSERMTSPVGDTDVNKQLKLLTVYLALHGDGDLTIVE
jgi:hypothetical protein